MIMVLCPQAVGFFPNSETSFIGNSSLFHINSKNSKGNGRVESVQQVYRGSSPFFWAKQLFLQPQLPSLPLSSAHGGDERGTRARQHLYRGGTGLNPTPCSPRRNSVSFHQRWVWPCTATCVVHLVIQEETSGTVVSRSCKTVRITSKVQLFMTHGPFIYDTVLHNK